MDIKIQQAEIKEQILEKKYFELSPQEIEKFIPEWEKIKEISIEFGVNLSLKTFILSKLRME